ncbi:hypothetical protein P9E76_15490 [Schinkia azotoformans]|uniref:Uncharacterized protein n=1 Tax=Schinkia azotoformans LMG 9581 TaxID=1131731 RepID=K6D6E7_SCHAZ|nr:hypothetical protein [Schinkia azotoformans]EKN68077.1 hypothetical protein BAZO_06154 [Schinkia azotoformans LMG 9581]MEC1638118.1 hypothetical protein [Schinkia azotoformans]MEC1946448.1 hypothetical protein [Schinkia azotoformans]
MDAVGNMSNYLKTELLKACLKGQTFTGKSQLYLALYTSDPMPDDDGSEVSGDKYSRKTVNFSTPADVDGQIAVMNTNKIEFAVADGDYGRVTHIGIRDATTGGNLLFFAQLDAPIEYIDNTGILLQPSDLIVYLT